MRLNQNTTMFSELKISIWLFSYKRKSYGKIWNINLAKADILKLPNFLLNLLFEKT